jgi:hypothetical protein
VSNFAQYLAAASPNIRDHIHFGSDRRLTVRIVDFGSATGEAHANHHNIENCLPDWRVGICSIGRGAD